MSGFYPGDLVLCRFSDEDVWYFAEVLSHNQDTHEYLLIVKTNAGYKTISSPVVEILHIGGEYSPTINEHENVRIIMDDGTRISFDEFCSAHTIRRVYSLPIWGTSEVERLLNND